MPIHLRDDDSTEVRAVLEGARLRFRCLTDAGIEDEDRHVRLDGLSYEDHLLEELLLLLMPSTRIHNDHVETFLLELGHPLSSDDDGIRLGV